MSRLVKSVRKTFRYYDDPRPVTAKWLEDYYGVYEIEFDLTNKHSFIDYENY